VLERHGGTVEKFIGDAVMAVWGAPVATEDDAERAVRAALDLTKAVNELGAETGAPDLRARAGVLTGEAAVTIGAEDDSDLCRSDIIEAVNRVDSGDGVAILTDMFGGTPSNLAISCMSRPKVEVLAGINLPMLVKLAKVREERSLPDAIAMAQEAGRKYVTIASRVLAGK